MQDDNWLLDPLYDPIFEDDMAHQLYLPPPESSSATHLPQATNSGKCWKVLDFVINDILMVLFSASDIFLDILVCRQFYINDQMGFFYASLSIFLFARKYTAIIS